MSPQNDLYRHTHFPTHGCESESSMKIGEEDSSYEPSIKNDFDGQWLVSNSFIQINFSVEVDETNFTFKLGECPCVATGQ
jgi:hypothetical protein